METVTLTIDGMEVRTQKGASILEAALARGIYIPHLCHHPDLGPFGACRLCLVDVNGRMLLACYTPVAEGMKVSTETGALASIRKMTMMLLLNDHPSDCTVCSKDSKCDLQKVSAHLGITKADLAILRPARRENPVDTSNPFFDRDLAKCILCGICVRTCDEIQGAGAIDFGFRGSKTTIATLWDRPLAESNCESCGECLVRCPVGALVPKGAKEPSREVRTTCPYCGVGCQFFLGMRGNEVVSSRGYRGSPVNHGELCAKGRFGHSFVNHKSRITKPLIRKDGKLVKTSWEEALTHVATRLAGYKGDAFAALCSAKCTNEDNYVIQKLARAVMGTNNIDHCARLCHAPSVAGLAQSFGSGAMTNSIEDLLETKCFLAIGTNTTSAHPVIGLRIRKAVRNGAKLIVANPREIELCRISDMFLRQRPGTDVALLSGLARIILDEGLEDREFIAQRTENFDEFRKSLEAFDTATVERITGVPAEELRHAARMYATVKPAALLYSMGITQHSHGTDNVLACGNLAMLTGNLGKPGAGVNPLRGQNNVQGSCDMGGLPNVLPGYQRVDSAEARLKFEKAWGVALPSKPGLTLTEIFDGAINKAIKAVYLVGENPVLSDPDAHHVEKGIKSLEFLVVQDLFLTETAEMADVVLPATSFAEKDGTFTNTERRVQRVRRAIEPLGRPDWLVTCQIAKAMGAKGFDFQDPAGIMAEVASLAPQYGGVTYDRLEGPAGLQWPCPSKDHPGTPILHTAKFNTPSGKGKFVPLGYIPPKELPDDEYPFLLTTGRSLYHFHTGTMTRKSDGLNVLHPREFLEIGPEDAGRLGISDGERIVVSSRRGKVEATAKVTAASPPGVVFMTFHFAESRTNLLTSPHLDPVAKIPEAKVCAVKVEKA